MSESKEESMKRVWITFKTKEDELKGFKILLSSGVPTYSTADKKYLINDVQKDILERKQVAFVCC